MVGKTDVFWQRLVYQTVRFMGSFQPNEADAMRSLNMLTHFYGVAWIAIFSAVGSDVLAGWASVRHKYGRWHYKRDR